MEFGIRRLLVTPAGNDDITVVVTFRDDELFVGVAGFMGVAGDTPDGLQLAAAGFDCS
jgi:hypothetical protein